MKTNEQRKQEMDTIFAQLEEGVRNVFTSDNFANYLDTFSKFHNYSFNNSVLIMMQMPTATKVASYADWKKKFNRWVKKGETGIKIIVPVPKKYTKDKVVVADDGTEEVKQVEYKWTSYRTGSVFDISQTDGEELPTITKQLTMETEQLSTFYTSIASAAPIPVAYDHDLPSDGANGYYNREEKAIFVKPSLAALHQVKTLFHELGHYYSFEKYAQETGDFDRAAHEVVAEAVAYTTLKLLANEYSVPALDSSEYSFGYLAGWGDKDLDVLKKTLSLIFKISNEIFGWVSPLFEMAA